MDRRPVLLGMNNPHSTDPKFALYPLPEGVTGWRILETLRLAAGPVSRATYLRVFDRRNVWSGRTWDRAGALEECREKRLWESLRGRTVTVFGVETLWALGLDRPKFLFWQETQGVRWQCIPHPSGLNRWFNDDYNSAAVAYRLEELYLAGLAAVGLEHDQNEGPTVAPLP